jgi:hypothetical protein
MKFNKIIFYNIDFNLRYIFTTLQGHGSFGGFGGRGGK